MTREPAYARLVRHYESCLERHGDTCRGVDWPDPKGAETRYRVMLDLVRPGPAEVTLLDFGCGAGHLYEFVLRESAKAIPARRPCIRYTGLDLSPAFVDLGRRKFPDVDFLCLDVLVEGDRLPEFDYVVMNGVFTEKLTLSFEEMWGFVRDVVRVVFPHARTGLAFNVISKHVDWERDDLFHLPFDVLAAFLRAEVSRRFTFRQDYGLYEYTAYVYR